MWSIIRTEISYYRYLFLSFFTLMPLFFLFEFLLPEAPKFTSFSLILLQAMYWNIFRNKMNRDYQLGTLPLPRWQMALARMLMVILPSLWIVTGYILMYVVIDFQQADSASLIRVIGFLALNICFFAGYFILRDLLLPVLRTNPWFSITKERSKMILMVIMLFALFMNFYFLLKRPLGLFKVLEWLIKNDPLANGTCVLTWLLIGFGLTGLTLVTFTARKSLLE